MKFKPLPIAVLHRAGLHPSLDVGSSVGSRRWPYESAHPHAWGTPHVGVILQQNDVRAWSRTIAFSSAEPPQAEVDAHVVCLHQAGLLVDCMPVLWTFWEETKVYWSEVRFLAPANEDYRDWLRERSLAFGRFSDCCHLAAAA